MKGKILSLILLSFLYSNAFAGQKMGGATSGGGDVFGISASRILESVINSVNIIGTELYSSSELNEINQINQTVKVIMTDEELPVTVGSMIQNGTAYSERLGSMATVYLNKEKWNNISNLIDKEILLHHELMIMIGIETTGDYHITLEFEKFRRDFWKLKESKNIFCSINIYEKNMRNGINIPGNLIGNASYSMTTPGVESAIGVIGQVSKNTALIWRAVISSEGYFRMELSEAKYKSLKNRESNIRNIDLGTINVIEPEMTYFDPYSFINPKSQPISFGNKYSIVVNCNSY